MIYPQKFKTKRKRRTDFLVRVSLCMDFEAKWNFFFFFEGDVGILVLCSLKCMVTERLKSSACLSTDSILLFTFPAVYFSTINKMWSY